MLFNSLTFIIFLFTIVNIYYISPHKLRWYILLVASYVFYMSWKPEFILLIFFSTIINYTFGKIIHKNECKAKFYLILGLIINFFILFVFKYLIFISNSFKTIYETLGISYPIKDFDIVLPMGISFYTFQAVSYIIDIYRKRYKPEKNILKLSLYITFFPQLVAGPIERADTLIGQLFTKKEFLAKNISMGLKIMLIGYFKKIVIADRVSILVDTVYNTPTDFTGISFIIATVFFAFQIYCDFSGYSDIAIGCAKLFGVNLMENFKSPYFSKSIKEFWQRWHISLSSWFKDYLYIPLGGSKCGKIKHSLNLFITFIISGLWHGANWTFILWGGLHGIYQIVGNIKNSIYKKFNLKVPKLISHIISILKIICVFTLVCFAWIFFRSNSISDAIFIISNLFNDIYNILNIQYLYDIINNLGINIFELLFSLACIILLVIIDIINTKSNIHKLLLKIPFIFRFLFYYILVLIILSLGVFTNESNFIYFQF